MEGMVEENGGGSSDPLSPSPPPPHPQTVTVTSVPSVIHSNQQSVIQTATGNIQATSAVLTKGNVILVSKQPPNSVIQTTQGQLQTLQVVDPGSDDSLSAEDDIKRKRRDILTRRPSYRKILNDLRGAGGKVESSGSECDDSNLDSELSSHSLSTHYQAVIPANAIQISSQGGEHQGLSTITMTNASSTGGAIVQYSQDGQFFVPSELVVTQNSPTLSSSPILGAGEDQMRKREMRLMKNREAAKECRRKKKEYIKCLENRVAILENQNKALIDELKTLKELYCQQEME